MDKDIKVAIVTGGGGGVGYHITKGLLAKGYHVVMTARNEDKANRAKAQLLNEHPTGRLEVMAIDLSDFDSVNAFAQTFKTTFGRLHLLVNNAGVLFNKLKKNNAGIEMQFATNHLGHFLLTSQLLERMPDSQDARVISLSSVAHKNATILFDDINCESQTKWDAPYAQSKLACLIFANELNRRLQAAGKKTLSLCAHPGGTDSGLFENMSPILVTILRYTFVPVFLHSTESAARPVLKAALDPQARGGDYYGPTGLMEMKGPPGVAKRSTYSQNQDVARRLWDLSEKLVGTSFKVAPS
ncbi:MAG: oxidoreductase [Pseudomonadota bacterium]